ncbi:hypothetical protein FNV43_RR06478 [Rhamnella rubrinervis]|uniref:Uncharacterized protein n=1 Tax=Rhamnella rubrinervis TaxID=2594499 RepID=A0A8K0HD69_9ROSA|nr:hypothetical protein FNV43_RR06301 [Rhamnella rubrinervis]KAF3450397.1 hypothetical protein FNV43_RR06478 [Rhamnella rubrinervis]
MSSKKVRMALMLVAVAVALIENFVRCDENMNINGNYIEPNHHHHYDRQHRGRFGHDHHEYYLRGQGRYSKSNKNKKMEGGIPHLDVFCPGDGCDPFAQDCIGDCFCFPLYLFTGICLGSCC